jgi:glucokinase
MIAALDIGGTKIAGGIVDRDGRVLAYADCPTHAELGFDDGLRRIVELLRGLAQQASADIDGIGIGCTGPVDPESGTIGDAELIRGWAGARIVEHLAREFDVRVALENDADAVALSEWRWGMGRDSQFLVYVTFGTGIGGGMVRDGELYRGAGGSHPEIGHIAVDLSGGPKCYCGLTGCWESLASGPALESWYRAGVAGEEICRRAREGEPKAKEAIARLGRYIAIGLVNVVTVYCPDVVLLGGGVMRNAALFIDDVRRMVRELASQVPTRDLRIDVVDLGAHAGVRGAAAAWLHKYERKERAW